MACCGGPPWVPRCTLLATLSLAVLCCAVLLCAMLRYAVLCAVRCCVVVCRAVMPCVVLCGVLCCCFEKGEGGPSSTLPLGWGGCDPYPLPSTCSFFLSLCPL